MPRPFDILALQFSEIVQQYRNSIDDKKKRELLVTMGTVLGQIEDLYKQHMQSFPASPIDPVRKSEMSP